MRVPQFVPFHEVSAVDNSYTPSTMDRFAAAPLTGAPTVVVADMVRMH